MKMGGGWVRLVGRFGLVLMLVTGCATPHRDAYNAGAQAALEMLRSEVVHLEAQHSPCLDAHYRLPVVSQVTIPTTIVGGVLIPQHQTYVVLQPGAWHVVHTETLQQPPRPSVVPDCRLGSEGGR
jgi:hypothetical protein